ncbi:hypothetical protein Trydic_g16011 [Trypoxylus dichotomus]
MLAITFGHYIFAKSLQKVFGRIPCSTRYFTAFSTISREWLPTNTSNGPKLKVNRLNDGVNTSFDRNYCSKAPSDGSQKSTPASAQSEGKYCYHKEVENGINKQIVAEFNAAYSYLGMACYFGRTSVALLGTQKFYMAMFQEEIEHAMIFIKYQEMRGGHVVLANVEATQCEECDILKSLQLSLCMEKQITDQLFELYALAKKHDDIRTEDFLVSDFIREQIQSVRNLGALIKLAERMGDCGIGEYLLDQKLSASGTHSK